jgi:hypothetical protein
MAARQRCVRGRSDPAVRGLETASRTSAQLRKHPLSHLPNRRMGCK